MKCEYCQKEFESGKWNKRFCCYSCCSQANTLKRRVEIATLTDEERVLRRRLLDAVQKKV